MHTQVFTYYSLPLQQALSCFTVSLYAHVALHKAKSKNLAEIRFPKLFELEKSLQPSDSVDILKFSIF